MYWFMCNKINGIPSIEVSDKDKLKKKKKKNLVLILKNYLVIVTVIKEETWSTKVIDVKTRLSIDNYVFKSLRNTYQCKKMIPPIDNYVFKSLTWHITHR